ncbi:MAG: hypothetical protein N2442_02915 [Spirochaetes bacterium]|nr:hypothetical protein [Spirochaetota bacterium]
MTKIKNRSRLQKMGWAVLLWTGLYAVSGVSGQGLERDEWRMRFEESFRMDIKEDRIPGFVLERMKGTLSVMEQEGWSHGLEPSIVAHLAAVFARNFDEDLRRGVSPVQAELLYRQMSQSLFKGQNRWREGTRSTALERLRERVQSRYLGKDKGKVRFWKSVGKDRYPSRLEGGGSDGSVGSGEGGGAGSSPGSGTSSPGGK